MNNQSATPAFLIHATYVINPADTAAFKTVVTRKWRKPREQRLAACFLKQIRA